MYDLIVIGAGASGLLSAALASENNLKTAVLERNNMPAKKLYATGNGHCNFLNEKADGAAEIKTALEGIGILGRADEEGRIYPRSNEASAVVDALVNASKKNGAEIICDCHVSDVLKRGDYFLIVTKDGRKFESRKLIIATGGKAGIQFGCYGEGYKWAQYMGHRLVKPIPALVPIECEEDLRELHGVRVKGCVSVYCNDKLLGSDLGEIQFTKDAISGICVMNLSRFVRLEEGLSYELSLDLFKDLDKEALELCLKHQKEVFGDPLKGLIPEKLAIYISNNFEGEDFAYLAGVLKDIRFHVKGTKGWADAQVTSGGIPSDEFDAETMESKIVPGLYFTGEIVDYDGPCGGYNLANAWMTAIKAARAVREG